MVCMRLHTKMPGEVVLNGEAFKSGAAATRHVKARIVEHKGKKVTLDKNKEDFELFLDVVKRHTRRGWYLGRGVRAFYCTPNNSLQVERTDGTILDISYAQCIHQRAVDKLTAAMRTAITFQIKQFKEANFESGVSHCENSTCHTPDTPLTHATCHVDHDIEFAKLKTDFLASQLKKNIPKSFTTNKTNGLYRLNAIMFKEGTESHRKFSEAWKAYHHTHARLQLVCSTCNLSVLKKTRGKEVMAAPSVTSSSSSTSTTNDDWIE